MNCKVCENTSAKNPMVSFFRFPKENKRCRDWADRCGLAKSHDKYGTLRFYKSFRICSDHFDPNDIVFDGRKKRLLQSAVPQLLLNSKSGDSAQPEVVGQLKEPRVKMVQNFCRLCAEETVNLTDIFGTQGKTLNLEDKLKYFPLVLDKCDVLPLRVCHRCISKVNQFCDFIASCLKAETKLKVMLDTAEESIKLLNDENKLSNPKNNSLIQEISEGPLIESSNMKNMSLLRRDTRNVSGSNTIFSNLSQTFKTCPIQTKVEHDLFDWKCPKTDAFGLLNQLPLLNESESDKLFQKQDNCKKTKLIKEERASHFVIGEKNEEITTGFTCDPSKVLTTVDELNSLFPTESHMYIFEDSSLKSAIALSQNTCTKDDDKCLKCQICFKSFHQVAFLRDHEQIHQSDKLQSISNFCQVDIGDAIYDVCLINLPIPEYLNNQKLNFKLHSSQDFCKKIRRIKCQYCNKLFKSKKSCRIHEITHSVAIPCKQCGKLFRSKSSLRQHKSVHSEERHFTCQVCEMKFKRKDTLSNHLRIHTGERPFVCKICGFAFKQRGDCLKHEKNHVKTEVKHNMKGDNDDSKKSFSLNYTPNLLETVLP
ncbi:hypothetical protein RUM44_000599 [Polyplax serrata]|uniref:Uncharacterized protein n=1 Tax=Polyplax serrata TaxID=468196 RepID=A0ABR1B5X9_POLSC